MAAILKQPSVPEALYGALDLGTNSCRLLIAQKIPFQGEGRGPVRIVDVFSRVVRLGEELDIHGELSPTAISRAMHSLKECARRLDVYRVGHKRCVATAACRSASNGAAFIQMAKEEAGISLEIISPEEESWLAVAGCVDLLDPSYPYAIVFDIGGGSTELVFVEIIPHGPSFRLIDCLSLPYGVLPLSHPGCSAEDKRKISQAISFEVNDFAVRNRLYELMEQERIQLLGASGTVTTLAAMILKLARYDRTQVHKAILEKEEIAPLLHQLWNMKHYERLNHPCIGPQRAEFILGGIAIFQGIYDILPVSPLVVADRGVREGILMSLMYPLQEQITASTLAAA